MGYSHIYPTILILLTSGICQGKTEMQRIGCEGMVGLCLNMRYTSYICLGILKYAYLGLKTLSIVKITLNLKKRIFEVRLSTASVPKIHKNT